MKRAYWINFGLLALLSFNTAVVKLLRMDFEMELFRKAGFSDAATIAFGIVQLTGALLLCLPRTRRLGAGLMAATFAVATGVVFTAGMIPFGIGSLAFVAMAAWPLLRPAPRPALLSA